MGSKDTQVQQPEGGLEAAFHGEFGHSRSAIALNTTVFPQSVGSTGIVF